MTQQSLTPMMRHFLEVKQTHPDCLIFYRCGDFYETFYEDARTASRELDLTLTSRDKNSENPVPLAGVPYHAVDQYIARLIEKGYKVAIVEQLEDPKQAKGMVKRDVVRVVTPGLVVDAENLDAGANNFLVSLLPGEEGIGIACLDISTGEFRCAELKSESELAGELVKLMPREMLLPDRFRGQIEDAKWLPWNLHPLVDFLHDVEFDRERAERMLTAQFQTDSLKGFGVDDLPLAVAAAGALLSYVKETQKQDAAHILALRPYAVHDYMVLDEATKTNLELERTIIEGKKQGSLLGVLDRCVTPAGSRMLRQWLNYPLLDAGRIRERQNIVEDLFLHAPQREVLRERLTAVGDLARLVSRVTLERANARHMLGLGQALAAAGRLLEFLSTLREDLYRPFLEIVDPMPDLADELLRAIVEDPPLSTQEGRMFRKGYDARLDEIIELAEHGKDQILRIEASERKAQSFPLKVRYNRVFGYYIEVSKVHAAKAPAHYIRKQTLANAERFVTPELKEFEERVLTATERRNALEAELFAALGRKVGERSRALLSTAEAVGRLDALASFAHVAATHDYVRPEISESGEIRIVDGRHPVIEALQRSEPFIPNDLLLDDGQNRLLIITGPNMAGKSTVMRQAALIVLLAQMGSFVPAREARIGVVDRIFTRVGAADNLVRGLSTFMVEMTETSNILHNATRQSLIVLDEIGRGTSTFDGLSIAWAVAEYIHDKIGAKTLFATHYHELTELARTKRGVRNFSIAVKEWGEQIIFLRKLIDGAANRSYGIQVGRLAGLPPAVIERAKEVLRNLETGELDETGLPSFARHRRGKNDANQLSLFGAMKTPPSSHPILDEIDRTVPEALSPIEALNLIFRLKKERDMEK
ncbi:MAG: DNA mismatch repair protein MutS [Myxococcales bacterium]|nr:MAG: DNA mismatch repair protein MutS [Myxococcales bacterium]